LEVGEVPVDGKKNEVDAALKLAASKLAASKFAASKLAAQISRCTASCTPQWSRALRTEV